MLVAELNGMRFTAKPANGDGVTDAQRVFEQPEHAGDDVLHNPRFHYRRGENRIAGACHTGRRASSPGMTPRARQTEYGPYAGRRCGNRDCSLYMTYYYVW